MVEDAIMEALLVRIDHFHNRKLYVSTLKTWLEELGMANGRLVTMGDVHLLFSEATPVQIDALVANFATKNIDTNMKDEPCIDRFIDVVGRKPIASAVCKGFLEMNALNASLLERLIVTDWHCEKEWLDDALSTPRTKALIKWRDDAKSARKDRRKRAAQDRDAEKAAKRAKLEEDQARADAAKQAAEQEEDGGEDAEGSEKEDVAKVADAAVHQEPDLPAKATASESGLKSQLQTTATSSSTPKVRQPKKHQSGRPQQQSKQQGRKPQHPQKVSRPGGKKRAHNG